MFTRSLCHEAFSAFEDEQKRRNRFTNELQQQIADISRRTQLTNAAPLLSILRPALVSNEYFLRDIKARMDELIAQLLGLRPPLSGAELLSLQSAYAPDAFAAVGGPPPQILNQPTDTLILRVVCADALLYPGETKAFLSGNTRDFGGDEVRGYLAACGLRYFSTTDALLGWMDGVTPDSVTPDSGTTASDTSAA